MPLYLSSSLLSHLSIHSRYLSRFSLSRSRSLSLSLFALERALFSLSRMYTCIRYIFSLSIYILCGFCAPLVRLAIISPHSLYFSARSFDSRFRCTKGPEVSYLIRWLSFLAHPASTACSNPHLVHGSLPIFWANPTVSWSHRRLGLQRRAVRALLEHLQDRVPTSMALHTL